MDQNNSNTYGEENLKDSVNDGMQSFGDSKTLNYGSEYIGIPQAEIRNWNKELFGG